MLAQKTWKRLVKTVNPEIIMIELAKSIDIEWRGRKIEFIPHASTWLNRECFEERVEALEDDGIHKPEFQPGCHRCTCCAVPHDWGCDDETCSSSVELACKVFIERVR